MARPKFRITCYLCGRATDKHGLLVAELCRQRLGHQEPVLVRGHLR